MDNVFKLSLNVEINLIKVASSLLEFINRFFNYFLTPMDKLVEAILWKMLEVQRMKKANLLYDDLLILEDLQTKAVLRLMKTK